MSARLSKILNLLMAETRINAEELSRKIGIPASTIKKVRNNKDSNPTIGTLEPIAKYFEITISELIGDIEIPKGQSKENIAINQTALTYVPLITWKDAINWPEIKCPVSTYVASEHTYSNKAYSLLVEEENWENLVKDTALLIDPSIEPSHRDYVIIHKSGQDSSTLKQLLIDEDMVYLKPATTNYQITILTPEHRILGVVVEYKKHLKK